MKSKYPFASATPILLVFIIGSACFASVDQNFPCVWHIRVDGDDNNEGHSYQTGLASINAAVSAAANGDIIYIWPGDYAETVDLDAYDKALTLIGISRSASRITHGNNAAGIKLENGCVIKNLSVILTVPPGDGSLTQAVLGASKINCIIEDCDINGIYDGIYMNGAVKPVIRNCRISSRFDALSLVNTKDFLVDNCTFEVSNAFSTTTPMRALIFNYNSRGICRNLCININREDAGIKEARTAGIEFYGGTVVMENFTITVTAGANVAGNVYGVHTQKVGIHSVGKLTLSNGVISATTTGSGEAADIYNSNSAATIAVQNIIYSRASGAITQGGSGWGEAVTHYADPNGFLMRILRNTILSGYNRKPTIVN